MKKVIAILLLVSLVSQCIGSLGVLAWYQINQQYISTELCENRNIPELECFGQCVLMKKLKALEDKHDKTERNSSSSKVEIPHFIMPSISPVLFYSVAPCTLVPVYKKQYDFLYCEKKFHPPKGFHLTVLTS